MLYIVHLEYPYQDVVQEVVEVEGKGKRKMIKIAVEKVYIYTHTHTHTLSHTLFFLGSVIGKAAKSSKVTGGKKGAVLKGEEKEGSQLLGQGVIICDPLVELVKEENDRLWMAGNTTLAHLTLSC